MNVLTLVFREIFYRKINFLSGLLSVSIAAASLIASMTLLKLHDQKTSMIILEKQKETHARMRKLEDDYRKITKDMGFNVLILPKDQNLGDMYAEDFASKTMPEEYVMRLSNSKIITVNHLLPSLQQKLFWKEKERTIILIGTRGEVPLMHRNLKKPMAHAVEPGTMTMGGEIFASLNLKIGDEVTLMGKKFKVGKNYARRGNKDDITVWIDLPEAQELLNKKGRINGILALNCHCAGDRLSKIRQEISAILPETQVIEFATQAIARAESRDRAALESKLAIEAEKKSRYLLKANIESYASLLIPLIIVVSSIWVALLAFGNVRERGQEIGVLRAMGCRSSKVLTVFLMRSFIMGLVGAVIGTLLGLGLSFLMANRVLEQFSLAGLSLNTEIMGTLLMTPLVAMLASWIPSLLASTKDPAVVLREN